MGLGHRIENGDLIERLDRAKIDNLRGNIFLLQLRGDRDRKWDSLGVTNNRDIATLAFHFGLAEWNEQLFIGWFDHSFRTVEKLRFENENWVVVAHGRFQ